ncbi:MAG: heavy metal translocating P-type ATPase, partial [Oscillospiraceae bacterium]|nr:heavy metal translocating P-type ATPase [Oscillospiraceae bacterium]
MEKYSVSGMSCAACQAHVEKAVSRVAGVTSCSVSLLTNSMSVEGTASEDDIIKAVTDAGYGASRLGAEQKSSVMREREKALDDTELPLMKKRLAYSAAVLLVLMYFSMGHMMLGLPVPAVFENHVCLGILEMLLSLIVLFINRKFFTKGFGAVLHGGSNMDTLVALGSAASFGYSLAALFSMAYAMGEHDTAEVERLSMNGMWFESAAMIPTLITIGKTLEAYSKGRTTDALRGLMRLAPDKATLLRDGKEVVVDIGEVKVGDIFAVRAGESIPVDGIITEGGAAVNESALTGESIPVDKTVGDTVSAATVDQSGYIVCRATGVGEDTMLSKIIKTVYDAAATKAPIARIADRVSAVFVPCVVGISLLTLAGWLIAGSGFTAAFSRAVSVLVISCPCALGLATPVAIMAGSGLGAKNGILYKTASALEMCGRTEIIALDKTGTITCGAPRVTDVIPLSGCTREELLRAAYSLESKSRHPLAAAVSEYCAGQGIEADDITGLQELAGNGLSAVCAGRKLCAGSERFISQHCDLSEDIRKQSEA